MLAFKVRAANIALILGLLVFFGARVVQAEATCTDPAEITTYKDNLPRSMQNLPIFLIMDKLLADAAIHIFIDELGKLKVQYTVKSVVGNYDDNSYVQKICKDGEKFKFYLQNKPDKPVEIREKGNDISYIRKDKDYELIKSTPLEFEKKWSELNKPKNSINKPRLGGKI